MLMQKCSKEMIEAWKAVYAEYKTQLRPNKKTASEVIEYLKQKYPLAEPTDGKWKRGRRGQCDAEQVPCRQAACRETG